MLTTFDKSLLNIIQRNLPIAKRPFLELANILGTTEENVIERLCYLKENGYIRRIGPFFDSGKLEYKGTLVALKVKKNIYNQWRNVSIIIQGLHIIMNVKANIIYGLLYLRIVKKNVHRF